jgi:O-acetyl-ADP-ribose deacetylase (regulator of RNase III)
MGIAYVTGDASNPGGTNPRVIAHVCNDIGGWGAGFVLALSRRWPSPEGLYRAWARGEGDVPFALGQVQFVEVEDGLWVANLIGQHGVRRRGAGPPVRYEAIREGLRRVAEYAGEKGASVHMPRIGCGLAGGRWEEIGPIIEAEVVSRGVAVTVYDLPG